MCKWLTRTLIDREGKQTKTNTGDTPSKTSEIPTPGSAAARGSAAAPAPAVLPPASADIYSDPSPEQVSSLSSTSRHHGLGCSGIDELRRRLVVLPPPLLLRRRNRRLVLILSHPADILSVLVFPFSLWVSPGLQNFAAEFDCQSSRQFLIIS